MAKSLTSACVCVVVGGGGGGGGVGGGVCMAKPELLRVKPTTRTKRLN